MFWFGGSLGGGKLCGENTANNNMDGEFYNSAVRAHKLKYGAPWRILCPEFVKRAAYNEVVIPEKLHSSTKFLISGFARYPADHGTNSDLHTLVTGIKITCI